MENLLTYCNLDEIHSKKPIEISSIMFTPSLWFMYFVLSQNDPGVLCSFVRTWFETTGLLLLTNVMNFNIEAADNKKALYKCFIAFAFIKNISQLKPKSENKSFNLVSFAFPPFLSSLFPPCNGKPGATPDEDCIILHLQNPERINIFYPLEA